MVVKTFVLFYDLKILKNCVLNYILYLACRKYAIKDDQFSAKFGVTSVLVVFVSNSKTSA